MIDIERKQRKLTKSCQRNFQTFPKKSSKFNKSYFIFVVAKSEGWSKSRKQKAE